MLKELPEAAMDPVAPTLNSRHGAIHSIASARRQRSRRTVSPTDIRVLLVGSHALGRAGLGRLLEDDAGVAVIGEAARSREAAELLPATDPHVVLLDAGWREPDPAACTRLLAGRVAVLLLTDCEADDRLHAAIRAGAAGVLQLDSHPAELASAVRTLAGGGALLPPRTARRLIRELADLTPDHTR